MTPLTQDQILERVRAGEADWRWVDLPIGRVTLRVMPDAMKLDGLRFPVTARTAQQIADLIAGSLTTPLVEDMIYRAAAVRLRAVTYDVNWWVAHKWEAVERANHDIDAQLGGVGKTTIVSPVGKAWVITNTLLDHTGKVANYGLHSSRAPYPAVSGSTPVWQGIGWFHSLAENEWDYSQLCRLMSQACLVDGNVYDVRDVLQDKALASLISHEGVLRVLRQPGVEEITGALVLPPEEIEA